MAKTRFHEIVAVRFGGLYPAAAKGLKASGELDAHLDELENLVHETSQRIYAALMKDVPAETDAMTALQRSGSAQRTADELALAAVIPGPNE